MQKREQIKISHNWKILAVIVVLLVLLLIIVSLIPREKPIIEEKECIKDSDCIKQQLSCCSCSMGGEERCMSRQTASLLQNQIGDCKGIMCIALYNCKETTCSCIDGKCVEK